MFSLLNPRNLKTWPQRLLAMVMLIAFLAALFSFVAGKSAGSDPYRDLDVCASGSAGGDDCLTGKPGSISSDMSGSRTTYYFVPADGSDRQSFGSNRPRMAGNDIIGLYHREDGFVGVQNGVGGERRYQVATDAVPKGYLITGIGAAVVFVGTLVVLGAMVSGNKRRV